MKILLGFYYGIGDFLSAVPVIRYLSKKREYQVFVAIGEQNRSLTKLIDLNNVTYLYSTTFSVKKVFDIIHFVLKLKVLDFDGIYVSPHVQDHVTSWKIPIMLKFLQALGNKPRIVGAKGDRNSRMYNECIRIDKSLPLMQREIAFYKLASLIKTEDRVCTNHLLSISEASFRNEIIVHPGASKPLKKWSLQRYSELCTQLLYIDEELNIRFIALPEELEPIKAVIKNERVLFESSSIDKMVKRLSGARAIITMDSGFSHIAGALELPHIALFGSSDPEYTRPITQYSQVIFKKELGCQPCNAHYCRLGHNECMELIKAQDVIDKLGELGVFQ